MRSVAVDGGGSAFTVDPPSPPLAGIPAAGDGSGLPGRTTLDVAGAAERYPGFAPGPLAREMARGGPLVYYELEATDGAARVLRLAKAGSDLDIRF